MSLCDNELITKAQNGDADAFGQIYERHVTAIYSYLYAHVSNRHDAEDLTETTFFRAWQSLAHFEPRQCGLRPWLYRIAHNALIDWKRCKRPDLPLDDQMEIIDNNNTASSFANDYIALQTSIGKLPTDQKEVIALRFFAGFNHAEIASAIGKSEGACRMIQLRALKALAKIIGDKQ